MGGVHLPLAHASARAGSAQDAGRQKTNGIFVLSFLLVLVPLQENEGTVAVPHS